MSSGNRQPHPLCAGSIYDLLHLNGNEWSVHLSGGCLVAAPGQTGYKHKNNRYPLHSLPSTIRLSVCCGSSRMNKTYHNQNLPPQEVSNSRYGLMGKRWLCQGEQLRAIQNAAKKTGFFGFFKYTRAGFVYSKRIQLLAQ